MENQNSTKNLIALINKLNEAIGRISNQIYLTFKLVVITLILTSIAISMLTSEGNMARDFGILLSLSNIPLFIYNLYSIFQLGSKLKKIENENNIRILEILKSEKN